MRAEGTKHIVFLWINKKRDMHNADLRIELVKKSSESVPISRIIKPSLATVPCFQTDLLQQRITIYYLLKANCR